jgi:hypothetical protein
MEIQEHSCKEFANTLLDETETEEQYWGGAVSSILFDTKANMWLMSNEEYATGPVWFCPFCGIKLPIPPQVTKTP